MIQQRNSFFLSVSLLITPMLFAYEEPQPIVIDNTLALSILDGTVKGESSMHKAHLCCKDIDALMRSVPYGNSTKTIEELITLEQQQSPEHQSLLIQALDKAIKIFEENSDKNFKDVQESKHLTVTIIRKWSNQRQLPNTFLLEWANVQPGHEKEHFRQHITSFAALNDFLRDLKLFLRDFMRSCPKSLMSYSKKMRNNDYH
jgi:hypothetical protein